MEFQFTIGWWMIPVAMTVVSLSWAIPMRKDERPDGSMFSGFSYAFGGGFRILFAVIISLVAWLIWALLT